MRQTIAAAVAVLALAACPEVATGPQGPEGQQGPAGYSALASGTRIKARVGTTADGAKLFLGWHDAELGVDCEFLKAADGQTRCLPVGPVDEMETLQGFGDPECKTKPVIGLTEIDEAPTYALAKATKGTRHSDPTYYSIMVTGRHTGTTYWLWPDGSCGETEVPAYVQWLDGEFVDPESAQALHESVDG